jgi:hypothetical protein
MFRNIFAAGHHKTLNIFCNSHSEINFGGVIFVKFALLRIFAIFFFSAANFTKFRSVDSDVFLG